MTDALPAPLVAPEVDLSGLGFMMDVDRVLASELVAIGTPEECWAAFMLWCRAWKQRPPSSLPNDERLLAAFSGSGKRWPKVRAMALRGFVECSDGRLYHHVLAEDANEAWKRRREHRKKRDRDADRLRVWRETRGLSQSQWEEIRRQVFKRDGFHCTRCNSTDDLHCDHIVSLGKGGSSDPANLATLCRACHSRKTATEDMPDEMRDEMGDERDRDMRFVAERLDATGQDETEVQKQTPKAKTPPDAGAPATFVKPVAKKPTPLPADFGVSERVRHWADDKGYDRLDERLEHFIGYCRANGKKYVDWDDALMNAIRGDWAHLPPERAAPSQPRRLAL